MIRQKPNIITNFKKKRRKNLAKKIFAYFIFVLFFLSLIVFGLSTEEARIKEVIVSGNVSIKSEDIKSIVNKEMYKKYAFTWYSEKHGQPLQFAFVKNCFKKLFS